MGHRALRCAAALLAGLIVVWMLASGTSAQTPCTFTAQPYPACQQQTMTAQAGGQQILPTATFTLTPTAAPGAQQTAATPVPANATTIVNGRGRVANIQPGSFAVIWTTDADMTGYVTFGSSASLGLTAYDTRGQAFSGSTHYVDVTGLAAGVTYYFDVVSGGQVDSNAGQHYQIKTASVTTTAAQPNFVRGKVLNPGGASPAGGALVWGDVKDANGQGSPGTSQLVAALAQADGGYQLSLNPRVQDLSAYFAYSNSGDQVELFARGSQGEAAQTVDTAVTQSGGTGPQEINLVLQPVSQPTPTFTPIAVTPTPTPAPAAATPTVTPAVPATPQAPPFPTPTPKPSVQLPVQLPALKNMLLAQIGFAPATPTEVPVAFAQAQVAATPPAGPPPTPTPVTVYPVQPGVPLAGQGAAPPTAGAPAGARPAVPPAQAPPAAPALGTPFNRSGSTPFSPGQIGGPTPRPIAAVPTPTAAVAFGGLAAMPPQVSLLFYGGLILALLGAGIGIYSVLTGPGWRPR